ncbi:MAG: class I SAM-dependent methyltransferase [Clostridia bacterium]|nr:class I SAM-dependent methyltransferase [Clostridia bacterium]
MQNVYDNELFFDEYQSMRAKKVNANTMIEVPIMKSLLPSLTGKSILDLGCGCGDMDKYFISQGASKVVATDISTNMIDSAVRLNADAKITYMVMKMEDLEGLDQKFNIVYSSLAFHYIEDFDKLLSDINRHLNEGGLLVFSQESPINTATSKTSKDEERKLNANGKTYYLLDGYCREGGREIFWNDTFVTKYHRTYATIVNSLIKNGFEIVEIIDSYASEEAIKADEKYKTQLDKPYFTFVKAKKIRKM